MNKKEILIPFVYLLLSMIFILACFIVYVSSGKAKRWTSLKMKIGTILLSFSYFSCEYKPESKVVMEKTCYMIFISTKISVEIDSNVIYGSIEGRTNEKYSYQIVNSNKKCIQKGNLSTKRFISMPNTEEFIQEMDKKTDTGTYRFLLFNCNAEKQDSSFIIYNYEFCLKSKENE